MNEKEALALVTEKLAKAELPKASLEKFASAVSRTRLKPIGLDICAYGYCVDLLIEGGLAEFDIRDVEDIAIGKLKGIEIFPWGIKDPDMLRVRIGQEF